MNADQINEFGSDTLKIFRILRQNVYQEKASRELKDQRNYTFTDQNLPLIFSYYGLEILTRIRI